MEEAVRGRVAAVLQSEDFHRQVAARLKEERPKLEEKVWVLCAA